MPENDFASAAALEVLVPYTFVFPGGVRRILQQGLPHLAQLRLFGLRYAEMTGNRQDMDQMEQSGVRVDRQLGVPGAAVLSWRTGLGRLPDLARSVPRMLKSVRNLRRAFGSCGVVYVHSYRELVLATIALGSQPAPRPGLVWHCHGITDVLPPRVLRLVTRGCARVIAISQYLRGQLLQLGIPADRVATIYNAIDAAEIQLRAASPAASLPSSAGCEVILLPSATLRPIKGAHLVIQALAGLDKSVHLWLTGSTEDAAAADYIRELRELIAADHLEGRVHFLGHRPDIYAVMRRASAVVVPSLVHESFGLVAAEAMALEKPVLVSNRGALAEVVGSRENGWICDPTQRSSMVDCLRTMLSGSADVSVRVGRARRRVEELFSFAQWAREVANVLLQAGRLPNRRLPVSAASR